MQIRPGTAQDISAVQNLEQAARGRYLSIDSLSFVAAVPPIAADRLRNGDLVVAESEGRMVGFILTNIVDGSLYITNISVDPASSGRGIGANLIAEVVSRAEALGLDAVTLTTFRAPPWNAAWFTRFGFETMREDEIGPGLRQIVQRQNKFLDAAARTVLRLRVGSSR